MRETLQFDFSEYSNLEDFIYSEKVFQNDLYVHQDDTFYIYDSHNGLWYDMEARYHYAPIEFLLEEGLSVKFNLIEDQDYIKELEVLFYEYE